MATAFAPSALNWANVRCSCGASGVVKPEYTSLPGMPLPSVPTTAHGVPSADSAVASQWLHDVLPFVPVTPATSMDSVGSPYHADAIGPASSFSALTANARDASGLPVKFSG